MPVLDAKALQTDPQGTAFLRDVLRRDAPAPKAETKAARSGRRSSRQETAAPALAR